MDVLRLGVIPDSRCRLPDVRPQRRFRRRPFRQPQPGRRQRDKFFGRGGIKLADETEDEIEAALHAVRGGRAAPIAGRRRRRGSAG